MKFINIELAIFLPRDAEVFLIRFMKTIEHLRARGKDNKRSKKSNKISPKKAKRTFWVGIAIMAKNIIKIIKVMFLFIQKFYHSPYFRSRNMLLNKGLRERRDSVTSH